MFAPFSHHIDVSEGAYQWAHGTFFHTLYTLGFVGLLAMCFHLFEKYYILLKDHSMPAMISFFAFLGSGIYGLIDVSYYFINYMILLLLILIVTPTQVQFIHIQWKKEVKAHG